MKNKVWLLLPTMVNIYIYMYIYITRKEYGDTVANYGHDKAVVDNTRNKIYYLSYVSTTYG